MTLEHSRLIYPKVILGCTGGTIVSFVQVDLRSTSMEVCHWMNFRSFLSMVRTVIVHNSCRGVWLLMHIGSFIPLRVSDKTALSGMDASHILETNKFDGYIRWLLHSPGVSQDPVSYSLREERGHGIIASYW